MKHKLVAKVIEKEGECNSNMEIGDKFFFEDMGSMRLESKKGICPELFNSIFPYCMALSAGGEAKESCRKRENLTFACPDPESKVVIELKIME